MNPILKRQVSVLGFPQGYVGPDETKHPIDTLVVESDRQGYAYENTKNTLGCFFKGTLADYGAVRIETKKGAIDWQPLGMAFRDTEGGEAWIASPDLGSSLSVDGRRALYNGTFPGVHDEFVVQPGFLKHNIVIDSTPEYVGSVDPSDLWLSFEGKLDFPESIRMFVGDEEKTGPFLSYEEITLRDASGNTLFRLPKPFAYEKGGEGHIPGRYRVEAVESVVVFSVEVPWSWLVEEGRSFPVVVDPTITVLDPPSEPFLTGAHARGVAFSHNGKFLAYLAPVSPFLQVWHFDADTGIIGEELDPPPAAIASQTREALAFSKNDQFIIHVGPATPQKVRVNHFDPINGVIGAVGPTSESSPTNNPIQVVVHPDGNYIFCYQHSGSNRFYGAPFNETTGQVGPSLTSPTSWPSSLITNDIAVHPNGDFVAYAFNGNPGIRVWPFNKADGTFGSPESSPVTSGRTSIDFHPGGNFLIGTTTGSNRAITCFPFNPSTGVIGSSSDEDTMTGVTGGSNSTTRFNTFGNLIAVGSGADDLYGLTLYQFDAAEGKFFGRTYDGFLVDSGGNVRSLFAHPDGRHFAVSYNNPGGGSVFEISLPLDAGFGNLAFVDPFTSELFVDAAGEVLKKLDFGQMASGQTSHILPVRLLNLADDPIQNVVVTKYDGLDSPDELLLSDGNDPFVPEGSLVYPGPFEFGEEITTFYVRAVAGIASDGLKEFSIEASSEWYEPDTEE